MRKRKPIGIKRASKLMHDLGLRTPEDILLARFSPEGRALYKEEIQRIDRMVAALNRPPLSVQDLQNLADKMTPEVIAQLTSKIGDCETMADIPVIDFVLIEGTGNRCGCCHQPIKAREGIAFGRPGLLGGKVPPINVCAECVRLAHIHLDSAKEGLI